MLTKLQKAWFSVYDQAQFDMTNALAKRGENRGILVHTDIHALRYQHAHFRARRAKRALMGPSMVQMLVVTGKGLIDQTAQQQRNDFLFMTRKRLVVKMILRGFHTFTELELL